MKEVKKEVIDNIRTKKLKDEMALVEREADDIDRAVNFKMIYLTFFSTTITSSSRLLKSKRKWKAEKNSMRTLRKWLLKN